MAPDTIVPSEIKPGTVTFDICHLLSEGRVLISNDRKYVCVEADPNNAKVAITSENKNMYVQPVWSMEDDEGPMSLELVIVKEVVLERRTTMVRGDAVIRSVLFVGRSSSKDPKKIDVLEVPKKYRQLFNMIFPTTSQLSESSQKAYNLLNGHSRETQLFLASSNEGDSENKNDNGESQEREQETKQSEDEKEENEGEIEARREEGKKPETSSTRKMESESGDDENRQETCQPIVKRRTLAAKRKRKDDEHLSQTATRQARKRRS